MQLQPDDLDGKEISLNLHQDGELASVETSSGGRLRKYIFERCI